MNKTIKIGVANRKGGTGKSSISREVAFLLNLISPTVLVDVDPKGVQADIFNGKTISLNSEDKLPMDDSVNYIYDFPGEDDPRINAISKMDLVLIPYNPDYDSFSRTVQTYNFIEPRNNQIILICNTYKDETRDYYESVRALEDAVNKPLIVKKLRDSRGMRTAANSGKSILDLFKEGGINKISYKPLLEELSSILSTIVEATEISDYKDEKEMFDFFKNSK